MRTTLLTAILVALCAVSKAQDSDLLSENIRFAEKQFTLAVEEAEKNRFSDTKGDLLFSPRTVERNGKLRLVSYHDWTAGFFPGSLWYTYELTGDKKWETKAREFTGLLEPGQYKTYTHDLGFLMYCSYGNGYRLTRDPRYKEVLVQSARSLATRYNPTVGSIRSWDHGTNRWEFPVIIDNMMNLELLFMAARETGDKQFYDIATAHANTTLANHFRKDGSSYHVVNYDPRTGKAVLKVTHQGLFDASAWARGQAWGLYGFTVCYRETGDKRYLKQAEKIAGFIFSHPNMPADLIPYWDLDDPRIPDVWRDASAATVTASALYELSRYAGKAKAKQYIKWADTIMQNLTLSYRAQEGGEHGFLLLHSTGNLPSNDEIDKPINYADYYFMEALVRKKEIDTRAAEAVKR